MPTIQWLEICGFRAFTTKQRLDFSAPIALVSGPNSHGKTAVAEAVEFLLSGETLRRALLGGAKAEFEGSLRNAHLDPTAPVWVRAGILGTDGTTHEVKRTLTQDYRSEGVCTSELTIDGDPAVDLDALGISLSDPPLRTPILFQHTVRFALSSSPKERADYFRAIIEVADLETVREELKALPAQLEPVADPALERLSAVEALPALTAVGAKIRRASDLQSLEAALAEAHAIAATELSIDSYDATRSLADQAQGLLAATQAQGERTFPTAAFSSSAPPALQAQALAKTAAYCDLALEIDRQIESTRRLFEATLALPQTGDTNEPIDCPVCETPSALTPRRLEEMRKELAGASQLRAAQSAALAELDGLSAELGRLPGELARTRPAAAALSDPDFATRVEQAAALIDDGASRLSALHDALGALDDDLASATVTLSTVREAISTAREVLRAGKALDLEPLQSALAQLETQFHSLPLTQSAYADVANPLLEEIRIAAAEREQLAAWVKLAELGREPNALFAALNALRARALVLAQLELAIADVEAGIGKVVDEKFEAITTEIATWWKLLRPEEPVEFKEIGRRGDGRRFVLFKALLRPALGGVGIERDALGVFSDSQLNALGLSAFLARADKQQSPFVILDDPVQAGDQEHRATFNAGVLQELIDRGVQVIVVSHDDMLSKLMHSRYEHLPINGFSITMTTPGDGARIVATSDTAQALLERAGATLATDHPEFRKSNASKLRDAAERLAKEIVVRKRTEVGEAASIADYEGKTLGPLIADLEPYLQDPSHKGKWKNANELLSPGPHDADVPTVNDLRVAFGDLKRFRRDYLGTGDGA